MVASTQTIAEVYKVLEKHLKREQIRDVLSDLQSVEGNRSFEDTINALCRYHTNMVISKKGH